MCLSLNAKHHAILASEVHLANLPGGVSQLKPNRDRLHLKPGPGTASPEARGYEGEVPPSLRRTTAGGAWWGTSPPMPQ